VAGIVTEKKAVHGMRFMPGETLYQVPDLSSVWAIADSLERDIGLVRTGGKARVTINAHPGKHFEGVVAYVYPTLNAETRAVPARIELANPGRLLKPSMFAQVELPLATRAAVPSVPVSAVIDSGTRRIILIRQAEGRFEPRAVCLGARSDDYVEVLAGVSQGEQVVVAANFLIDSESNLRAAVASLGPTADGAAGKASERSDGGRPASWGAGHRGEGTVTERRPRGAAGCCPGSSTGRAGTASWSCTPPSSSPSATSTRCCGRRSTPCPTSPTCRSSSTPSMPARRRRWSRTR